MMAADVYTTTDISIHVPREGDDFFDAGNPRALFADFNPRPP